ncbi:hypothetical protein DFH08DRAFT_709670, partial [Mycena albidolilacea]
QSKYKPRNHVSWIVSCICYVSCMALVIIIRYVFILENKRRDAEPPRDDGYDDVFIQKETHAGGMEKVKIAKELLDSTDRQNCDFRYVY